MVKQVTYLCNLCRESHDPKPGTFWGINFTSGRKDGWLKFITSRDSENHICYSCADAISREFSAASKIHPVSDQSKGGES